MLAAIQILYTRPISLLVYTTTGYTSSDIDFVYTANLSTENPLGMLAVISFWRAQL